jgi:predicted O-methyltransferase YrrM
MPKNGVCAEVGIFMGKYSEIILRVTQPTRLHLIDIDPTCINHATGLFGPQLSSGQVCLHLGDSATILSGMPDAYFDWVYIDGDHSYEGVKRDLEATVTKIKEGGLIAMNDYTFFGPSDFSKYGVMEAANEFCITHNFEFIYLALQGRGYHDVVLRQI